MIRWFLAHPNLAGLTFDIGVLFAAALAGFFYRRDLKRILRDDS